MSKQSRHQSVVSRQSDSGYSNDHWLKEFENKLQKTSVQPRGESLYDQINSIMNTKSKYPSVQAAVDDMMHRSGLSGYLDNVKQSQDESSSPKKTAQSAMPMSEDEDYEDDKDRINEKTDNPKIPQVIREKPSIQHTLENLIKDSKGNMPIPAIIARLHALHAKDVSDEGAWEDERLIRLVSQLNLQAKKDNPGNFDNYETLGRGDHSTADSDIDASNTDAFNALMPAKI